MPTFYDPIELADIDIDDSTAKFYIIELPKNGGYKFCATTQNLDSPHMKYEPETRVKEYWSITREQLSKANLTTLFPKDKIRTEPFKTAQELNEQCHFDPPFNPNVRKDHFGQRSLEHFTSNPEASNESFPSQRLMDSYLRYVHEVEQYRINFQNDFFSNMGNNHNFSWTQEIGAPQQQTRMSRTEMLLQEARRIGCTEDQVEAIRTNILDKPYILEAIIDNHAFSVADFRGLTTEQIVDIGTIALNAPRCILDLTDGRVTIEQLAGLDSEALRQAVETGDYPQNGTQLR